MGPPFVVARDSTVGMILRYPDSDQSSRKLPVERAPTALAVNVLTDLGRDNSAASFAALAKTGTCHFVCGAEIPAPVIAI